MTEAWEPRKWLEGASPETMTFPLYDVVIPTLGNHDLLWETLAHLGRTDLSGAETIVVYNGLPEGREKVATVLASRFPSVRFVSTPEPYGIARAYNLGARAGRGRFVAFLHDDVLIDEVRWLSLLSDLLVRRPDVGLVGGSEPKYTDRSPALLGELEPGVVECDWSPTISVARRSDLEACSFDEFYLVGLEDKDWALAFRRKGLKVVCRKVNHVHVGTKGSYTLLLNDRRLLDYYSKEGVRERHFLTKNKDVLSQAYQEAGWKKWGRWDRDWKKTWWMKLYVHSFFHNLKKSEVTNVIARWRVFMGFLAGAAFLFLSHVSSVPRAAAGLLISFLGLLLRGWAAGYLEKGKRLAQDGPYAWVRHPLYAGSFLMALGFCIAGTGVVPVSSGILWGVFVFLFGWIYPQRIKGEEQSLEKYFGDGWRSFTARNSRFLPSLRPFRRPDADRFLWSRYLKNKEYNAAIGWAAGVALVVFKGMTGF